MNAVDSTLLVSFAMLVYLSLTYGAGGEEDADGDDRFHVAGAYINFKNMYSFLIT